MATLSLLATVKKDLEFKVFFKKDNELYTVILTNESATIENAIMESINKFNHEYNFNLIEDPLQY